MILEFEAVRWHTLFNFANNPVGKIDGCCMIVDLSMGMIEVVPENWTVG